MASIITAVSHHQDPALAAAEIGQAFANKMLSHVLFFCSAQYDLGQLATELNEQLNGYLVSGCTTAGELTPDGYSQGSITAIGFDDEDFAVSVGFVK